MRLVLGEAPGHQVPWLALQGHAPGLKPGGVGRIVGGKVAGQKIHADFRLFRHLRAVEPVADDLEIGAVGVQRVGVVPDIGQVPLPHDPVVFLLGQARTEMGPGVCGVIPPDGPAVAVNPDAVDAVAVHDLLQLGDQQPVGIVAEDADGVGALTVFVHGCLIGVGGGVGGVIDAGVVDEQGQPPAVDRVAPDFQVVGVQMSGGVAQGRGVAGVAGVALAVALDKVRLSLLQIPGDVRRVGPAADVGLVPGVKVEMQSEIAFHDVTFLLL